MTKSYESVRKTVSAEENPIQLLFDLLEGVIVFTEEEKKALLKEVVIETYPKGTILVREGEYKSPCYFVLKGCVRKYYEVDGEEKTTAFYTESDSIGSSSCTNRRMATGYYLECLEETIVSVGTEESESSFFERFPRFEAICRKQTEEQLHELSEVLAQYIISSPEQRYLNLLKTQPQLLARVPQYHLASFIGVKPESLSRIRKRIMTREQA